MLSNPLIYISAGGLCSRNMLEHTNCVTAATAGVLVFIGVDGFGLCWHAQFHLYYVGVLRKTRAGKRHFLGLEWFYSLTLALPPLFYLLTRLICTNTYTFTHAVIMTSFVFFFGAILSEYFSQWIWLSVKVQRIKIKPLAAQMLYVKQHFSSILVQFIWLR